MAQLDSAGLFHLVQREQHLAQLFRLLESRQTPRCVGGLTSIETVLSIIHQSEPVHLPQPVQRRQLSHGQFRPQFQRMELPTPDCV